jgi:hypothetical protein
MGDSIRQLAREARVAKAGGPAEIARQQRAHLADIVSYASVAA